MSKFECKKCGNCCTKIRNRGIKNPTQGSAFLFRIVPSSMVSIGLFEWEVIALKKTADELTFSIKTKPVFFVYDKKSDATFSFHWNLDYEDCPFYAENFCKVNKNKPLVCQSYPLLIDDLFSAPNEKRNISTGDCPNVVDIPYTDGKVRILNYQELFPFLFGVYGDSFLAAIKDNLIRENIYRVLSVITENKLVVPAPVPKDKIKAVLRGKLEPLGLIEFLLKTHPNIGKQLNQKIRQIIDSSSIDFQRVVGNLELINEFLLYEFEL